MRQGASGMLGYVPKQKGPNVLEQDALSLTNIVGRRLPEHQLKLLVKRGLFPSEDLQAM
jgi:hypothetical protein